MSNSKRNAKSANRLFPSSKAYMSAELREAYFDELFAEDSILTNRLRSVKDQEDDPEEERKKQFKAGLKACRVTRKYESEASELYRLRFVCVDTYEKVEIEGTPEHPFWVTLPCGPDGKGRWIPIKNLEIGYRCISGDGTYMQLIGKEHIKLDKPIKVYNLEVEGGHTYFVGQGGKSILVHNKCGPQNDNNNSNEPSTELAIAVRRKYLTRATAGALCNICVVCNAWTSSTYYQFNDDGHAASASGDLRRNFLVHNALAVGGSKIKNGNWWTVKTGGWKGIYSVLDRDKQGNGISIPADDGINLLDQASFWIGSPEDIQGTGSYDIMFEPDPTNPENTLVKIKNIDMKWRWVDNLDAHSWDEYDWKNNPKPWGRLEGMIDAVADKGCQACYNFHINFGQSISEYNDLKLYPNGDIVVVPKFK